MSDQQPHEGPPPSGPPASQPPPPAPPGYGAAPPPAYGAPQQWHQQGYGYGAAPQPKTHGMAVAALVCGIVGLLLFNIVLGPLALIFGLIARNKIKASNGALKGEGLAIAGIVLGPIDIAVWLLIISIYF